MPKEVIIAQTQSALGFQGEEGTGSLVTKDTSSIATKVSMEKVAKRQVIKSTQKRLRILFFLIG